MNIKPEKTAISNGVSTSCKLLINELKDNKDVHILDYGCGKLRNTKFIINNNIKISIVDTKYQIEKNKDEILKLNIDSVFDTNTINFNKKYDAILLSFVLNVIPTFDERQSILSNIHKLTKDDGFIYIEVRDRSFVKNLKHKEIYNDGLVIGNSKEKTFQKPFTSTELSELLTENHFEIIYIKKKSGSIIAKVKPI